MEDLVNIVKRMEPEEATAAVGRAVKELFAVLDEDSRGRFLMGLVADPQTDKVSSLVHLWLAECMGEGVDPTQMCQSLVDKVAQSRQLQAITDPELLVLFEDWLEELEAEVVGFAQTRGAPGPADLAASLGLSRRGAEFLLSKLTREGKL